MRNERDATQERQAQWTVEGHFGTTWSSLPKVWNVEDVWKPLDEGAANQFAKITCDYLTGWRSWARAGTGRLSLNLGITIRVRNLDTGDVTDTWNF